MSTQVTQFLAEFELELEAGASRLLTEDEKYLCNEVLSYWQNQNQHPQWRMVCGDWREELVALHGPNGLITSGLTVDQAKALIDAHGGAYEPGVAIGGRP